jgi:GNAT superfamily N-acetyltransferase
MSNLRSDLPTSIRPATMADYPRLCALFEELDRDHYAGRPGQFRAPEGPARSEAFVRGLIEGRDSTILVACRPEGPVGLVVLIERRIPATLVRPPRRVVEVDNLVVTAACRGQGIGTALLRAAEAWARERRAETLELGVYEFNAKAVGFYQNWGMETDLRRMRKSLAGGW